jgi:Ala-tRNA(Pro) deacylase
MATSPPSNTSAAGAVTRFLADAGVDFDVIEHPPTYSARQEADATQVDLQDEAKTLVLHDSDGWRLAVLPASHQLDLHRARLLLGGSAHLRLATEEEIGAAFPDFEVGAMPPVGPMLPLPEIVDVRLLYRDRIVCSGGDHRHALRLDPRDLVRLAEPRVGDICEHDPPPRRKDFANLPKV